ncbi:MAG: hypothetical protein U0Q16_29780 [Bryobacteraceae bacterium]
MTARIAAALFLTACAWYAGSNAVTWWLHWWRLPYFDHVYWLMLYHDYGLWHVMSRNLNEHRLFFPSLVYWADLTWFGNRLWFTETCLALAHVAAFALLLRPFWRDRAVPLAAALVATGACLVFATWLGQCENLYWPFQFHTIFCNFAIVSSCAFFARGMARSEKMWGRLQPAADFSPPIMFGILATFSFGHGILVWPALALTAALRKRWNAVAVFAIACAAALAIYLRGYQTPPHHADPLASLSRPLHLLFFFSIYIARPFLPPAIFDQIHHRTPAFLAGSGRLLVIAIGVASILALGWFLLRYARRERPWPEEHFLIPVATAALASGVITALGRLDFPPEALLTGRYATLESIFWFSIAALAGLALVRSSAKPLACAVWGLALAGFVAISLASNGEIGGFCRERSMAIEQERLTLRLGVYDRERWSALVPNAGLFGDFLLPWYSAQRMPPFDDASVAPVGERIPPERVLPQDCQGHIDVTRRIENPTAPAYFFLGWAWNQFDNRDVERVLIVESGQWEIVGAGTPGMIRDDLAGIFHEPRRWTAGFAATTKPIGPGRTLRLYGKLDERRYCFIAEGRTE